MFIIKTIFDKQDKRKVYLSFNVLIIFFLFVILFSKVSYAACTPFLYDGRSFFSVTDPGEWCVTVGTGSEGRWNSGLVQAYFGEAYIGGDPKTCRWDEPARFVTGYCYHNYTCDTPCTGGVPPGNTEPVNPSCSQYGGGKVTRRDSPNTHFCGENCSCDTTKIYDADLRVYIGGRYLSRDWFCLPSGECTYHSGSNLKDLGCGYGVGWGDAACAPVGNVTAVLTGIPSNYSCSWKFYWCWFEDNSIVCPTSPSKSGNGCSAPIEIKNQWKLDWEIGPDCRTPLNPECYNLESRTNPITLFWNLSQYSTYYQYRLDGGAWTYAGTSNYRLLSSSVSIGDHTYSIRGVNSTPGCSLSYSPISTCTFNVAPSCTPNQGTLSAWGECQNDKQTRTCDGATCCGSTCGNCNGEPLERPCLRISGNIWSDDDHNGERNLSDYWKGDSSLSCTDKYHSGFQLGITGEFGNQISNWWCNTRGYGSYYGTPNAIEPESIKSATLSGLPAGYQCDSWEYKNALGVNQKSGVGCVASNLTMPTGSWVNVHWKISCTPNQGTLSAWGECQDDGKQYRTCTGNTNCPVGCTPGLDCQSLGNCNSEPLERNCLRVDGKIWNDDDENNSWSLLESWKGINSLTCTNKYYGGFNLGITSEPGNQIINWFCHSDPQYGSYYNTPTKIEPGSVKTFTLSSLPSQSYMGIWTYSYSSESGFFSDSGPGFTTDPLAIPISADWLNVDWEIYECFGEWVDDPNQCSTLCGPGVLTRTCQWSDPRCSNVGNPTCDISEPPTVCNDDVVCRYDLDPTVREIPPEITVCSNLTSYGPSEGATVTAFGILSNGNLGESFSGVTDSNGRLSPPLQIPYTYQKVAINVTKNTGGDTPENYTLMCPGFQPYTFPEPPLNYLPSDTIPAGGTYPSVTVNLGIKNEYKDGWVSSVDADIFANSVNLEIPDGPTNNSSPTQTPNGFSKTLINSSGNSPNSLGFIFSESSDMSNPDVEEPCPDRKGFETDSSCGNDYGGYSYGLNHFGKSHKSKWLDTFTFTPPVDSTLLNTIPIEFTAGTVYKISQDDDSDPISLSSNYRISGTGVPILYFDGNLDIGTNYRNTTPNNGRLLIIVDGDVNVSSGVGTAPGTFNMANDPNIQAGIISRGKIEFESIGGPIDNSNKDIPVMVSAPLISKTDIVFLRDLYHDDNAIIPAQSAKAFNKYLYFISQLERTKSSDYLYFTGLTTTSIDWEYVY